MTDLRIVDAPVLLQESITDDVKMPTGGLGNFSVRLGDILWYVITKEQLANKSYVDLSSKGVKDSLDEHIADKNNPHQVTKAQVGLGNVDNTADIDKPVSNATKSAIITATNDMATKTYVNSKDNLKADKSYVDGKDGDLSTLTTTEKTTLVKAINEVYNNTKGVVSLYDKNVEAGAGANGWTSDLVLDTVQSLTQKQINAEQEEFKKISTFNVVNALNYIDKSQHEFIKTNNLSAQNQTLIVNGIKDAITVAQSLKAPHFILPSGAYVANDTLIFDLPNDSTLSFYGTIASTCVGKELVIIGSKTTNRFRYTLKDISAYYYHPTDAFYNIKNDTNKTSTAVLLLNIAFCEGNIKQALNCYNGVLFDSTQPNGGISYNVISLGHLHDNIKSLRFKISQGGYTNENTTIGGSMGQSSNFPYTGEEVDVTFGTGIGSQKINNNLVFRPSLEASDANVKAAIIEGDGNQIYMPRIENSKDYAEFKIIFGATSNNCSMKGLGFGLSERNIQDNGVNNKYETSSGVVINGDSAISALKVKNISSSSAKAIAVSDTSDNVTFDIVGDGTVYSAQHGYFANGIRWLTSDGTNKDKGIFVSVSNPENNVVASVGSLHINTSTGVINYKKYGSGNVGWCGFQDVVAGSTTYRPTNALAGYQYFDTTLNKPVWWTGAKWVDATGNQV